MSKQAEALSREFTPGRDLKATVRLTWGSTIRLYLAMPFLAVAACLTAGLKARVS